MELSFKEFELLTYFLENEGIALSREKFSTLYGIMTISGMPVLLIPM